MKFSKSSRPIIIVGTLALSFLSMGIFLVSCTEEQEAFQTTTSTNTTAPEKKPTTEKPVAEVPAPKKEAKAKPATSLKPPDDRPRAEAGTLEVINYGFPGIRMDIPKAWKQKKTDGFRLTQFDMGSDETGRKSEFVVFYFGPDQGGDTPTNLARWATQMDTTIEPVIYQYEQDGLLVSEILTKGTLKPTTMGAGPTQPQPDSFLYGIIVVGGVQGSVFFKSTGPLSLLPSLAPQFTAIVESVKKDPKAKAPDISIPQEETEPASPAPNP